MNEIIVMATIVPLLWLSEFTCAGVKNAESGKMFLLAGQASVKRDAEFYLPKIIHDISNLPPELRG